MGRANYDDCNFMGQSLDESPKYNLSINNSANSLIFLISLVSLSLLGVVFVYSASFPTSQVLGLSEFSFAIRQTVYVFIGFVAGALILVFPNKVVSLSGIITTVLCIALLSVNLVVKLDYFTNEVVQYFVTLSVINYLSSYFANRQNNIERLREIIIPTIVVFVVTLLFVFEESFNQAFVFFIVSVFIFASGGAGFGSVLMLILFAIVPLVCSILSNPNAINKILDFMINGSKIDGFQSQGILRIEALTSGSLTGRGLGSGQYKYSIISGIYDKYIFCNICEETGYLGAFIFLFIFLVFFVTGLRAAIGVRKRSLYSSNVITCLVVHIFVCFVSNILGCIGIIPSSGISLPFISFGNVICVNIVEGMLIYKLSKTKESDFEEKRFVSKNKTVFTGVDYDQEFN